MFSCQTVACSQKDIKHEPHPEGITLYCGVCGIEMLEVVDE